MRKPIRFIETAGEKPADEELFREFESEISSPPPFASFQEARRQAWE
jgi:hypothetical protein